MSGKVSATFKAMVDAVSLEFLYPDRQIGHVFPGEAEEPPEVLPR